MSLINITTTYNVIAQQCPLTGGLAVFMAQSVLRTQAPDLEFNVDSLCALAGYRIEIGPYYTTNNQFDLAIYPYPASNYIYIRSNDVINSIKLFSIRGELMFQQHINSNASIINVSDLSNGLYFISVTNKKTIYTKKLQIIK